MSLLARIKSNLFKKVLRDLQLKAAAHEEDNVPELTKCPFEHMLSPSWSALCGRQCRVTVRCLDSGAEQVCGPVSVHHFASALCCVSLGRSLLSASVLPSVKWGE